ncbi:hypothetical protein AHAS_Ahas04G0097600 [Arachis hypogaea]
MVLCFPKYKWSSTHLAVKQNFSGYHPPAPTSNGGWGYHQKLTDSEHSNPWRLASETQDEQEKHMGYKPPLQNNSYYYPREDYHRLKEHPPSRPSSSIKSSSSLDYASTQSFLQNPYQSSHQSHNSFHTPQHNFTTTHSRHQNYSQPSSLELTDEEYVTTPVFEYARSFLKVRRTPEDQ